jgi:hypothetical protein
VGGEDKDVGRRKIDRQRKEREIEIKELSKNRRKGNCKEGKEAM